MHIALLGRQPELSIAELERLYGDVHWYSRSSALISTPENVDIQRLGGTQKAGVVTLDLPTTDWRRVNDAIVRHYSDEWKKREGKITLGLSAYDLSLSPRELQKTGLTLKGKLKQSGVSVRLVPNQELALSSATSHHNKLGLSDNKIELLIVRGKTSTIVAESTGAQNITALAARDQGRPRRDAFVGMLPPKLAQMMINLAVGPLAFQPPRDDGSRLRILDPFCGTGVTLQEAGLMGYDAYGTDLSEKMIRYSQENLTWLHEKYHLNTNWQVQEGDAMDTVWQQPIDAVASEAYLGQPFSAPPSPAKLTEVRGNCNHIIGSFLRNLSAQLKADTPVVLAVPAWRSKDGSFTHLPLIEKIDDFGFTFASFETINREQLLYFRPDQVVAREILVLIKK